MGSYLSQSSGPRRGGDHWGTVQIRPRVGIEVFKSNSDEGKGGTMKAGGKAKKRRAAGFTFKYSV